MIFSPAAARSFAIVAMWRLVVVVHADENNAGLRQPLAGGELRLGEREAEGRRNTHHFAGGAHFGAENRIDAAEFVERKHGRLHGVEIVDGEFLHAIHVDDRQIQVSELAAGHQARGDFRQRHAGGFADVRNRARGARIHFEHVHGVVLDGVLHVHQADDVKRAGEADGVVANVLEHFGLQRDRRQHAGGIAGMDAGFLDVLHDAGDDDVFAVGESVHVHFGGVFQELIDQNRALGIGERADLRRLRDVFLDRFQIVGDDHGAAAENVAGAHENRQADFGGGSDGFLRSERGASARLRNIQFREQRAEAAAIFGEVD